ncbi:MAG: hypothetical protein ACE5PT_14040 [Gemmatimonadales bacterium]
MTRVWAGPVQVLVAVVAIGCQEIEAPAEVVEGDCPQMIDSVTAVADWATVGVDSLTGTVEETVVAIPVDTTGG